MSDPDGVDAPPTVTVPIRPPADPLGRPDYADIPAEAAPQWDSRQWHDRPPL